MTEQEIIKKFDRKEALNELKREVSIRGSLSPFAKKMFEYLEEDLKEYYKLKEKPTEQEILEKFEELGYEIVRHERRNIIFKKYGAILDVFNYTEVRYSKHWNSISVPITFQEHQLLHELFKCWGAFDD